MLAKLKRRSDRFGKALRRVFRSPSPPPPEVILEYTDWHGLKALVDLLSDKPNGFEPLKTAIESLSACVHKFEGDARTRPEYAKIGTDMDDLFTNLARHIAATSPPTTTSESMMNISRSVAHQIEPLLADAREGETTEEGQPIGRKNPSEVLWAYRQVRTHLALFLLSENTRLWKLDIDSDTATGLEALPYCPQAHYRYTGPDAIPRNGCTENTRVDVLQDLRHWVHYGKYQHVFWLNGTAGTGKTTVAYSLCEFLENSGNPSVSYFCSREHSACRDVGRIMPSISYQLAQHSRPFRHAISPILQNRQDVYKLPIAEQFETLIATPLRKIGHTFGTDVVSVIDGIEECENRDDVYSLLRLVIEQAAQLPIRFLITVRPSPASLKCILKTRGERRLVELRLHDVDHAVVREDIRIYLTTTLRHLRFSAGDLENLGQQSGVSFTHAMTIVSYLTEDQAECTTRLWEIVRTPIKRSNNDIQTEVLYSSIIRKLLDDSASGDTKSEQVLRVLQAATQARMPAINLISILLKLDFFSLTYSVSHALLPVLYASDEDEQMVLLDEPFVRYLIDQSDSGRFLLDAETVNASLADACFDSIASIDPSFNICSLESSYLRDAEVYDLRERVADAISPELLYACLHWGTHLTRSEYSNDLVVKLEAFFSKQFLLWVEVLNLKRQILGGVEILNKVHTWLQKTAGLERIQQLVQDASAFLTDIAASPITESTPHIYVSGLQIMRPFGPVLGQYLAEIKSFAIRNDTDAPQGHTQSVRAVAYSPDGEYIVSGSYDDTIPIWNAHTGKPVGQPLTGHTGDVNSVAYSPDGAYIASGSHDKTIRIWDAHTGKPVGQPLTGHTSDVNSVAYSPDGAYIASGSDDRTVRIWDAHTGKPVGQPLTGHTGWVRSVAYSPDGAYIVSGSNDGTARIWDAHTGKLVGQPLTGHTSYVRSVAYSPDGAYIVSGSDDNTIRIWDAHTGKPVGQPLTGHTWDVNSVAYSPDGAYIASGSDDHTIRIWDAHTGKPVGQPLTGHTHWVRSVAYSPDGAYIVSGSYDHTIHIWFAPTLQEQTLLQAPTASTHLTQSNSASRSTRSSAVAKLVYRNRKPKPTSTIGKLPTLPDHPVPPITSTPFDWTLNDDGWVVGPSRERLVWIPSELRSALTPPNIKAIISTEPSLSLDFRNAKLGTEWEQCYEPR